MEKENLQLHEEVKSLIDKLKKADYEFEKFKTEAELNELKQLAKVGRLQRDQEQERAVEKQQKQPQPSTVEYHINNENEKLKNEVQKLRNDFNDILNKYSNLEASVTSNSSPSKQDSSSHTVSEPTKVNNQTNKTVDYLIRPSNNPVDIPALITDMPLKTIAKLNNYLIRNIIVQEASNNSLNANSSNPNIDSTNLVLARGNSLYSLPVSDGTNYVAKVDKHQFHHQHGGDLAPKANCKLCSSMQDSYFDLLKNELNKKIEIEVAKGSFNFIIMLN